MLKPFQWLPISESNPPHGIQVSPSASSSATFCSSICLRLSHQPPFRILHSAPGLASPHLFFPLLPACFLQLAKWLSPALHSGLCSNVPSSERPSLKYQPFLNPLLRPLTLICFSSTLRPEYPSTCLFFTCQASLALEHKLQYGQGLHHAHTKNSVA